MIQFFRMNGYNKELLTKGVEEIHVKKHLEEQLSSGRKLRVKFGIDPTGPKIHLGRAIPLRKLRAFQDLGHQIVLIIGDFTAQIGDPSDKTSKRPFLTKEQIKENLKDYLKQLGKIIDINKTEIRYNSEWLDKLTFREISQLAEAFTVQQMLARRNFKERYEQGTEISLREFMYPLMQGYDSVAVRADVELGGFDQLFNLMAGREIQRQYGQEPQDILATMMLEGTDGRKMSTSWGNVITIMDEPNDMFGRIMAVRDDLIIKYFTLCANRSLEDIKKLEKQLKQGVNPREIKFLLAVDIVTIYHSKQKAKQAGEEFNKVFQKKEKPTAIPVVMVKKGDRLLTDVLVEAKLASSKSEAKRLIGQKGVKVDGKTWNDPFKKISLGKIIIQVGKRKFAEVKGK
ncbi:MAG: tyrosine--tRNA ligase [bacterium]